MTKPVAWMEYIQDEEWEVWYIEPTDLPKGHTYKPLYTSPQIKELSDEEILQQAEWMFGTYFFEMIDDQYWIEFAKAILKKANEK